MATCQDLQVLWCSQSQLLPLEVTLQEGGRGRAGQQETDPQEPDQSDTARSRREGPAFAPDLPSRAHSHRGLRPPRIRVAGASHARSHADAAWLSTRLCCDRYDNLHSVFWGGGLLVNPHRR